MAEPTTTTSAAFGLTALLLTAFLSGGLER
jgi:hypothetical protein